MSRHRSRSLTRVVRAAASRTAIEALEGRRLLDSAYHSMLSGDLTQNWDSNLISVDNDWSNVPSIEGFVIRRPGTATINQDPQLHLDDPPRDDSLIGNTTTDVLSTQINVLANQTNGTGTAGGLREVEISPSGALASMIPIVGTIAMGMQNADVTADHTYLKLYINNTGKATPLTISYTLTDIDTTTTGNANQRVALQYRIGTSGDFTNVPEGFAQDTADITSGAIGKTTSVAATLPADTIGAGQVEIRILTSNVSGGSEQLLAVDNIVVSNVVGAGSFGIDQPQYTFLESAGVGSFTVSRPAGAVGAVDVNYVVTNINASAADYTLASGTFSFAANESSKLVTFPIIDDTLAEGPERFTVTLTGVNGGATIDPAKASTTITILDNDSTAPAIGSLLINEILINPADADNPGEYLEIRGTPGLSLHNIQLLGIEGDRGATSNAAGVIDWIFDLSDYTIGSNGLLIIKSPQATFSIPSGTTVVPSPLFDTEAVVENGSNTWVLLHDRTPYVVGVDLHDDLVDAPETLNLAPTSTSLDIVGYYDSYEGSGTADRVWGAIIYGFSATQDAPDAVTRFPNNTTAYPSATPVPNAAAWYGGNIIDPNPGAAGVSDYEGIVYSNTPGEYSPNKPAGAIITPGAANFPVAANPGQATFSPVVYAVTEEEGGVVVTVVRAGGTAGSVSVSYATTGGTATSNVDYTHTAGVLTFADGETEKTFFVPIIDDSTPESAETIEITLSNPTNGLTILGQGRATITIAKSDSVEPVGVLINELLTNPYGATETPAEYLELRGPANTTLVDVYLVAVEGDGNIDPGTIDYVINLTGATFGSNGLLLIKSNIAGEGFEPEDPATGVFGVAAFNSSSSGLESGTNTFLLMYAPAADPPALIPVVGEDYDLTTGTQGRGTLNLDPVLVILDSVAYFDGGATDRYYSDAVLTIPASHTGAYGFGGLTRFPGNDTPNSAGAFFYAPMQVAELPDGTPENLSKWYTSVTTARSANFPAGAQRMTPGAANQPFASDSTAPEVVSTTFNRLNQKLTVVFNEAVRPTFGSTFNGSEFELINLINPGSPVNVTLAVDSVSPDNTTVVLRFVNTGGLTSAGNPVSSILTDGNYTIRVKGGFTRDLAATGNYLEASSSSTFRFKNADFDGDFDVDFNDLLKLAQHYGTTSGATFATGDANYDGKVDFDDLLALAQRYGTGLPAAFAQLLAPKPVEKAASPATSRKASFGATLIV